MNYEDKKRKTINDSSIEIMFSNISFYIKEINKLQETEPYITTISFKRKYNPNYGDDRICKCGDPYYRHFDTYDDMYPCGCKYCNCTTFEESTKTEEEN